MLAEHDSPAPIAELMSLDELRTRLDAAIRLHFSARYAQLSRELPELLSHLYVHRAELPHRERERERLAMLLDDAYALTATTAFRFGFLDLSAQVQNRRPQVAAATGDPLRVAGAEFARTHLPLYRGAFDSCSRRLDDTLGLIEDLPGSVARAVRGQLHLRQAGVAARVTRVPAAEAHVAEARSIIASGVPARPYIDINCSAFNAAYEYISIPLALSDGTTAVTRADSVHIPANEEPRAVGHHWVLVARGWVLHGNRPKALEALNEARS
ncbi:MAG: hypothetical protein ACRDTE_29130, partial [Pseudonocardiaceae bacterium]